MKKTVIIDYGLSNLLSVEHAFNHFGVDAIITNEPRKVYQAEALVLPGVGAFDDGMKGLKKLGLLEPLNAAVANGVPLLGICLGMQMLFEQSEEFGLHEGLGFIPGKVVRIPEYDTAGNLQKVPHISWNPLLPAENKIDFSDTVLEKVRPGQEAYFIHSYEAKPSFLQNRLADTIYGGRRICAVATNGNVIGTQFHPEKSGEVGLAIINSFIERYC